MLTTSFLVLKAIIRRPPVRLDDDFASLMATIETLRYLKPARSSAQQGLETGGIVQSD